MPRSEIQNRVDCDLESCKKLLNALKGVTDNTSYYDLDDVLNDNDLMNIFIGMNSRYSSLIRDFPKDFDISLFEDDKYLDEESFELKFMIHLVSIIEKLETFKRMDYTDMNSGISIINQSISHSESNNDNINKNSLTNEVLSFQEAKQTIENMSMLPDDQIDEILQKIEELERITNSSERKSKKWEKAKDIIKWIVDKGFDIAKILLPIAFNNIDQT